jgi:hypothetical protein
MKKGKRKKKVNKKDFGTQISHPDGVTSRTTLTWFEKGQERKDRLNKVMTMTTGLFFSSSSSLFLHSQTEYQHKNNNNANKSPLTLTRYPSMISIVFVVV